MGLAVIGTRPAALHAAEDPRRGPVSESLAASDALSAPARLDTHVVCAPHRLSKANPNAAGLSAVSGAECVLDQPYRNIADLATARIADCDVTQVIDYCQAWQPTRSEAPHETTSGRLCERPATRSAPSSPSPVLEDRLLIVGIVHGGQDYEAALGARRLTACKPIGP